MKKLAILLLLSIPFFASAQDNVDEKMLKPSDTSKVEVLTFSETMPEFPGGTEELYKFISKEMKYPKRLKKEKIEARVISKFIINKEGGIENIQILNKVEPEFAEEVVRVLSIMPNWKPGMQMGKPVNVVFTLPISFKLK
ncbi:MAG: energy transducer TonB [Bacteroidia bacterium]|nr:energy transducer TonB [Bacteroidia bacterium]